MPPRTVKRGAASAGSKRGGRVTRGTPNKKQQPPEREVAEETVKVEEVSVVEVETKEIPEEVTVQEKSPVVEDEPVIPNMPVVVEDEPVILNNLVVVEEKPPVAIDVEEVEPSHEVGSDSKPLVPPKKEVKDEEFGKDERLDLEDNDPESEPEEEFDEKEIGQADVQDMVYGEGEPEDNVGDGEGVMGVDDVEDVQEDHEGEEDDQQVAEGHEHAGMVDADEDEHHEVVEERRKRKEFEVFVGGLDKDVKEEDLKKVFSAVGEVTEVRLMMNPQTKKNKGFAFLRFATVEEAKRAVSELKNPVINGKQCGVTPSQDSDTLFLGNICKTWKKDVLKEKLKHYGVDNVEDLTLVEDSNNEGLNRGFAFLEFSSRLDAMDAFKRLQKRDVVFGVDRPAKVSFADSFIDPGDEIMAQVKTVFVDSLPGSWDEVFVRGLLKKYGEIEKIELARNMPSAKRKDFGFVTFDTHDAAVFCAKSINNAELGEGDNKAKVRARLSRPLQRGKGKHASRADYWPGHATGRALRGSWGRPAPQSLPVRVRGVGSHFPPVSVKRPGGVRDRRPVIAMPERGRPIAPVARSYDRGPPVASYSKSSFKREYGRHEELHPSRSRVLVDYSSRVVPDRNASYREEYASSRTTAFSDPPRRDVPRRAYVDDDYGRRFERPPPPSYRDVRARDYDSLIGSKRPYSSLSDVPPAYADAGVRQSRSRLDYDYGAGASQYGDAYDSRIGRSNIGGYDGRSSISGSFSSDVGGMYSSSYGGDYMTRGSNVGGSSYSSMYHGRSAGGSSYMGNGGGSGSYY
ncbi:nucleolin-like [Cucurbita moschata]|uniref:Nucleolin-like n=1 Tax=Cucurbita moschata TaxID=3662 RepID=A0A6J1GX48_CUCMO|nr:nucleolin-like [Cucurbita moschata]XP_022956574.1 nucleolin-like [Cucurbita moschata]XP_022956651.1 nucleolin-like [Cucurbita moschata]XP_022956733.1 nucleolin-like [Cucurbita moschata]